MKTCLSCLVIGVLFLIIHGQGASTPSVSVTPVPKRRVHCLDCNRIAKPEDCQHQIECFSDELCMAEQYVTESGHTFYDVGCKLGQICKATNYVVSPAEIAARIQTQRKTLPNPIVGRKRQGQEKVVHSCQECCEGDYCNNYLCGGHVTNNLKCLSCQGIADMAYCDTLETCQPHEVCYLQEVVTDTFQLLYNSGCMRQVQCEAFLTNLQSMGGQLFNPCANCCNDSFCNAKCPVYPTTTPTPTLPSTVCPTFPVKSLPSITIIHNALVTLGCGEKEEVAFLVDNSKLISDTEEHMFEIFIRAFSDTMNLGPEAARLAYAHYNKQVNKVISIDKGDNSDYVDGMLENIAAHRGPLANTSDMAKAIGKGVRFISGTNQRPGAARYLVVLTEDGILDTKAAVKEAISAKQDNITVIIIGVGQFSHQETTDLQAAVTSPFDKHLFLKKDLDGLRVMLEDLAISKCERRQVAPTLQPDPCSGPKLLNFLGCGAEEDITLILDRSGSIHEDDWKTIHKFVHQLVDRFNIAPNASRLGMMTFNDRLTELIQLHDFPNKTELLSEIDKKLDNLTTHGSTNTALALQKTIEWYDNSKRTDAVKVAIIFTDGGSDTKFGTVAGAMELHRRNVSVFVIGIGHEVDIKEQLILASDPDIEHMINVQDVNGLLLYLTYLEAIRCRDIANQSTSATTATFTTTTTSTTSPYVTTT